MEKATIYDYARMCAYYESCNECPFRSQMKCHSVLEAAPDKANEIILKWCKEHPVETRQSKFLVMFPNARTSGGVLMCCPQWINNDIECNRQILRCDECRRKYWFAEADENE